MIKETLSQIYNTARQDLRSAVDNVRKNISEHRQRMKDNPEVKVATYHVMTYAACLLIPAAVGIALSIKHDGTPNIWRVPDGSEKIEFIEPEQ